MKSGYLGVDVFFVISGFLMSRLYVDGQPREFYLRRARRLLPAYFATVFVTLVAAMAITLPVEMEQVATQTMFASAFASNIGFWLQNSYFSKAEFNPLLHLWSLGVEIQFYLLVPLLLFFARRYRFFLPIAILAMLLACLVVTSVSPKTSFFFMPLRIWEFLIGVAVAERLPSPIGATATWRPNVLTALRYASLALILMIPLFPLKGDAPSMLVGHPALGAALICFATGGVLALGLPAVFEASVVGRALTRIGDWSYSIYLAHFPVLVLFSYRPFSGTRLGPLNVAYFVIAGCLVAALSAGLYLGIERNTRRLFSPRRAVFAAAALAALALVSGPLVMRAYPENEQKLFAAWTDRDVYRCGKYFRIIHPIADFCELTDGDPKAPVIMLVGNSHADAIKRSFASVAQKRGYRVFFPVPNDPLMNSQYSADWVIEEARRVGARYVFLHFSPIPELRQILETAQKKLESAGFKTVLLMPPPVYDVHIPAALYLNLKEKQPLPSLTKEAYYEKNAAVFALVNGVRSKLFRWYEVAPALCDTTCRQIDAAGRPLYFDSNHLTLTGARLLEPVLDEAIASYAK